MALSFVYLLVDIHYYNKITGKNPHQGPKTCLRPLLSSLGAMLVVIVAADAAAATADSDTAAASLLLVLLLVLLPPMLMLMLLLLLLLLPPPFQCVAVALFKLEVYGGGGLTLIHSQR